MATDEPITWHGKGLRARYRPEAPLGHGLVGSAPWINAVLLVLLYLWLTWPYVLQPGVIVQLPEAPFAAGTPYGHRLAILSQESPELGQRKEIIFFDDERYLVEDKSEMAALQHVLLAAVREKPKAPLVIEADQRVLHGTVVDVFNMAAAAGVKEINIATRPNP